jgi:hypothetical protein
VSNRTFLYSTAQPDKPLYGACPEDGRLLVAAMSIPLFWYMLYDKRALKLGPVRDDPDRSYFHLTVLTGDGLARAEARWPEVARVLGRGVEPLFRTWVGFVRKHAKAYVHCETAEWYRMFKTHDQFADELRRCLDAFGRVPVPRRRAVTLNRWWAHLLGQARVSQSNGKLRPLGNTSYCGLAYGYAVPWSQKEGEGCGALKKELRDATAYGLEPKDIRNYLDRWGGVDEFRVPKCRCGSRAFRLVYDTDGAQRSCASCGAEHFVCDTEQYWAEAKLKEWTCTECESKVANLGVGFGVDLNGRTVDLALGLRCDRCGRLSCCTGWETNGGPELFDQV